MLPIYTHKNTTHNKNVGIKILQIINWLSQNILKKCIKIMYIFIVLWIIKSILVNFTDLIEKIAHDAVWMNSNMATQIHPVAS